MRESFLFARSRSGEFSFSSELPPIITSVRFSGISMEVIWSAELLAAAFEVEASRPMACVSAASLAFSLRLSSSSL